MAKKVDEAAARALLEAGKDAARRALEEFGLGDEEKAARAAEREKAAKLRRWKWIAIGVALFLVAVSIVFLIAKIWVWILVLAVLAVIGFFGWRWARARLSAPRAPEVVVVEAKREEPRPEREARLSRTEPPRELPKRTEPDEEAARIERELAELKKKHNR